MTAPRVLLVEDDASIRRFVALALEDLPIELVEAGSVAHAERALAGAAFALVITDLMLPDGHGLDLLARLRAEPLGPAPLTVVFSAGVTREVRARASALGVWRVLDKPVSLDDLTECVTQALGETLPGAATPAPQPAAATPLDEAGARALASHFGGQTALFAAFRAASLAQFPEDVRSGDAACRRGDAPAMLRLAHSLKTVLQLLGADDASARARALESLAQGGAGIGVLLPHWQDLRAAVLALR